MRTDDNDGIDIEAEILGLLADHPLGATDGLDLDLFSSERTAQAWFAKRRGKTVRHVGYYSDPAHRRGRAEYVYCNGWYPKQDNMRHEKKLTTFCLLYYGDATFRRGPNVDERWPDGEMKIGDYLAYLEMFCGTQSRPKVQKRWKKYAGATRDIRVIVSAKDGRNEEWLERVKDWSRDLLPKGYYTTLDRLIEEGPYAFVWDHWNGKEWLTNAINDPSANGDLAQEDTDGTVVSDTE